jgi:NADPH:quinone reductase-like Zn-dependent oxidoreductase
MESMKAVRIHAYGDREVLFYEDTPCPEYGSDEVMVRIAATSVNPFDWAARNGYLTDYYSYAFPTVLGLDVSGVVEAVGSEVQGFEPGDAVFGRANPAQNGAYAEYISIPAAQVARKPQTLDYLQAAAVPHVAVSAWRALFDVANLQEGQTVLIHGAAGGVGSMAVQLAKIHGARVIGTASANNLDFLRSLGVDEAIDYNATRFEEVVHDVDLVLDLVGDMGDQTLQRSWTVLKPGGLLASLVQYPSPETAAAHGVRSAFITADECSTEILEKIGRLIDAGKIQPVVSTVHALHDVRQAHERSESRHLRGKIVLQVAEI